MNQNQGYNQNNYGQNQSNRYGQNQGNNNRYGQNQGGRGGGFGQNNDSNIQPVSSLNPYQSTWRIKVRVTKKEGIRIRTGTNSRVAITAGIGSAAEGITT